MERNPNKPRLWLDDEQTTAEAFFKTTGESRVSVDPMSGIAGAPLSDLTTGEQAGFLCTDPAVREELLASLKGKEKKKPEGK